VLGFSSGLVNNLGFSKLNPEDATTPWNYYYFKTGDAILYDPKITVLLNGQTTLRSPATTTFTVNNGKEDPNLAGKLSKINGQPYPNRNWKVFTG